jgi:transposase-like protein
MEQSEDFQDGLREMMRGFLEEILEEEMDEALGAAKCERSETRRGYRSGYYGRGLVTRLGKIDLPMSGCMAVFGLVRPSDRRQADLTANLLPPPE